jgi:hypothetical protein
VQSDNQHDSVGKSPIGAERAIAVSGIPNNLGSVIKSVRILEFEEALQRRANAAT